MPHQSSSNASSTLGKMIIDHLFPPAPESEPETKHDHHWIIDGLYTYRSSDFNGQDYKQGLENRVVYFAVGPWFPAPL